MTDNHGTDAAFEQRLACLSEEQFDALVARTRPHLPPPQTALERARAEQGAKAAQLWELTQQANQARGVAFSELMTPQTQPPAEPAPEPTPPLPPQRQTFPQQETGAHKAARLQHMLTTNPEGI